ncbi:MAG: D-glucuronyl C5-epimerase family protein [Bacteroidales bacterium]|nr:D-glucuronyl C5-epimerase family protein [Bacteroidales bacterium]
MLGTSLINSKVTPYPIGNGNISKFLITDTTQVPKSLINGIKCYYPVNIGLLGTTYYNYYYSKGDSSSKAYILLLSSFLKDSFVTYGRFGTWETEVDNPAYKCNAPWSSAMAQGLCISIMLEAYSITADIQYFKTAKKAINAFGEDFQSKGIRSDFEGYPFFEEYACDPPKHVLNGFIFSLAGLYNFYENTGYKKAIKYFNEGVNSLLKNLSNYDIGFASLYDNNPKHIATAMGSGDSYHEIHIAQLLWLYSVTGEKEFYNYAHKFLKYDLGKKEFVSSPKIHTIEASSSIDSKKHGPDKLYDGNWTYEKYWSSRLIKPVSLQIDFGKGRNDINTIVLFNRGHKSYYSNITISYDSCGIFKEHELIEKKDIEQKYFWQYNKHKVLVEIINLQNPIDKTSSLKLTFKGERHQLVKLNEIDIHFNREEDLMEIINVLNY